MKPILSTLLALTLLAVMAAACIFCLRVGVEIGRSVYEGKQISCVQNKKSKSFYCTIKKRENTKKGISRSNSSWEGENEKIQYNIRRPALGVSMG